MKKHKKWQLNLKELIFSEEGSTSTNRKNLNKSSRKLDETSCRIKITHAPTEISVEGEIQSGHYSKKQMQKERDNLRKALLIDLTKKIAKKLRLPDQYT